MCPQVGRPIRGAERAAPDAASRKKARCATATRRRQELGEALSRDTGREHDPRAVARARDVAAHRFDAGEVTAAMDRDLGLVDVGVDRELCAASTRSPAEGRTPSLGPRTMPSTMATSPFS